MYEVNKTLPGFFCCCFFIGIQLQLYAFSPHPSFLQVKKASHSPVVPQVVSGRARIVPQKDASRPICSATLLAKQRSSLLIGKNRQSQLPHHRVSPRPGCSCVKEPVGCDAGSTKHVHIFQQLRDKQQENQPSTLVTFLAVFSKCLQNFLLQKHNKKHEK